MGARGKFGEHERLLAKLFVKADMCKAKQVDLIQSGESHSNGSFAFSKNAD